MSSARCQKGYCSYLIEKIPVENEAYACLRRPTKPPYGTACLDRRATESEDLSRERGKI